MARVMGSYILNWVFFLTPSLGSAFLCTGLSQTDWLHLVAVRPTSYSWILESSSFNHTKQKNNFSFPIILNKLLWFTLTGPTHIFFSSLKPITISQGMKFTDWPGLGYVSTLETELTGVSPMWAMSEPDQGSGDSHEKIITVLLLQK